MRAYDEAYLQEIVETQGDLFENISEYVPGIDVRDFIEKYMSGKTRSYIDRAKAFVCTMDAGQLWDYFQKEDDFCPRQGEMAGGFISNWIGQFYAYYQWYYNVPSREIVKMFPVNSIR